MAAAGERSHCFPSRANGASIERPIKGKTTATPLNNIPLRPRLCACVCLVHERALPRNRNPIVFLRGDTMCVHISIST